MNNTLVNLLTGRNMSLLSLGILMLRFTIGIILFIAGAGKLFGWFGGFGIDTTIQYFSQIGISAPLTYLSSYTEFLGGFLLTIGFFTRPAAFAVAINMAVATIVTLPSGFLVPNGAAYPFTFLIISITILLSGPLSYSIDELFLRGNKSIRLQ